MVPDWLHISDEIRSALADRQPVVALESTLITHGLTWPKNFETAKNAEQAIRNAGAIPATIAVIEGKPIVGISTEQLEILSQSTDTAKASRRDLAAMVTLKRSAGTTVSATMALAHMAGIRVFSTGGIGGAHKQADLTHPFDISADLTVLSRTPVFVVCAGAKSILDLPQTLELLETFGVPVVGYRTDEFAPFYVSGSGGRVSCRVENPTQAAKLFDSHVQMGGKGAILAQLVDEDVAIPADTFKDAMEIAQTEADAAGIAGSRLTPFLLGQLADLTVGKTVIANQALIVANARLAAEVAKALCEYTGDC